MGKPARPSGRRREREIETGKVRMAEGGNPCQHWRDRARFAPRNVSGFDNEPHFGWVEETSTRTLRN